MQMHERTASNHTIAIVIPVYNEEANIRVVYERIVTHFRAKLHQYSYEILFVDDYSTDASLQRIERLARRDPCVRYIHFSKNFGKEIALTAGLHHVSADAAAAIMMDADLQHPPERIASFVKAWERGNEVVIGVRTRTRGESWWARASSRLYYWVLNAIADTEILSGATDFRLLDRVVIDAFKRLPEHNRLTRGLIDWLGFQRATISFVAPERAHGQRRYTGRQRIKTAAASIVSHSVLPLKFIGYIGIVITVFAGLLGLFIFFEKYVFDDALGFQFSGPAILAVINLFLAGVMLMGLGLIALYIAPIKTEIANRPLYVIRRKKL